MWEAGHAAERPRPAPAAGPGSGPGGRGQRGLQLGACPAAGETKGSAGISLGGR